MTADRGSSVGCPHDPWTVCDDCLTVTASQPGAGTSRQDGGEAIPGLDFVTTDGLCVLCDAPEPVEVDHEDRCPALRAYPAVRDEAQPPPICWSHLTEHTGWERCACPCHSDGGAS